jgi:hypothetical protein
LCQIRKKMKARISFQQLKMKTKLCRWRRRSRRWTDLPGFGLEKNRFCKVKQRRHSKLTKDEMKEKIIAGWLYVICETKSKYIDTNTLTN